MMVHGECYLLPTWEDAINATVFGVRSGDAIDEPRMFGTSPCQNRPRSSKFKHTTPNLGELQEEELKKLSESAPWPTPCAHDKLAGTSKPHGFIVDGVERQRNLNDTVARLESAPWPTPTAKGNGNRSEYGGKSGDGIDTAVKRAEGILKPTRAESAPWPTPTCSGLDGGSNSRKALRKRGHYIPNSVSAWPTPTANDYKGSGRNGELRDRLDYAVERGATKSHTYPTPNCGKLAGGSGGTKQLHHLVEIGALRPDEARTMGVTYPTVKCNNMVGGSGNMQQIRHLVEIGRLPPEDARAMADGMKGAPNLGWLNPDWIEWLMNWPLGWTDPDATALLWLLPEDDPADIAPDADGYVPRITSRKEYRINRVETLGNGQFPLTATAAFIFGRAILAAVLELIKEHTRHAETGTV